MDRVPLPAVPGSLAPWVNQDIQVGGFGSAGTITRVYALALTGPSGTDLTFDLRTATGGGGSGITLTIPAGSTSVISTSSLTIPSTGDLYLRITQDSGAAWLTGWLELVGSVVSGALTTITAFKEAFPLDASLDPLINSMIAYVSSKMETYMERSIVQRTFTGEKHDGPNQGPVVLRQWPASSVTVKEDGTTLTASEIDVEGSSGLIYRLSGTTVVGWSRGTRNIEVDYTGGYATTPGDLVNAANMQVAHEISQTKAEGSGRLGQRGQALPTGASVQYVPGGFLPEVIEAMKPYARRFTLR